MRSPSNRGYVGGVVGMNVYSISAQLSNGSQRSASVRIPAGLAPLPLIRHRACPLSPAGYFLPGGATSTHGHVNDVTIRRAQHLECQDSGGYRFFNAHRFDSP
jgi:hypothetical protein